MNKIVQSYLWVKGRASRLLKNPLVAEGEGRDAPRGSPGGRSIVESLLKMLIY
jgi:hypothetical protein